MKSILSISVMKLPTGSFYITVLEPGCVEKTYMEKGVTYTSKDYREIRNKIAEIKEKYEFGIK